MTPQDTKGLLLVGYCDDDCVRAGVWMDGVSASSEADLSFTLDEWGKLLAWSASDECPGWFWVTTDAGLEEA